MRKQTRMIVMASVAAIGVAAASALYAQHGQGSSGSMMGQGMMGGGGMMGSMSQMMDHCSQMMSDNSGSRRPNDRWRKSPDDKN